MKLTVLPSVMEQCKALATNTKAKTNNIPSDQKPLLIALRSLQTDIAGLKSAFEHQATSTSVVTELQDQLRHSHERAGHLEAQLAAAEVAEAKMADEVARLTARAKSAESTSTKAVTPSAQGLSEDEIEKLV